MSSVSNLIQGEADDLDLGIEIEVQCRNCAFFGRAQVLTNKKAVTVCRKNPPKAEIDRYGELKGVWPPVNKTDWCGDFTTDFPYKQDTQDTMDYLTNERSK